MNTDKYIIATNDGVINGSETAQSTQSTQSEVQQPADSGASPAATGFSFWGIMGIYALFIIGMYYFISKPQKKKQKQIAEMQSQLNIGDNVHTSSGFHGKIVDIEDNKIVVEFGLNKGIMIPVNKSEVFKTIEKE